MKYFYTENDIVHYWDPANNVDNAGVICRTDQHLPVVCAGVRDHVIKWTTILIVNNTDILSTGPVHLRLGMLNIVLKNFSNSVLFLHYNKVEDISIHTEKSHDSSGLLAAVWSSFKNKQKSSPETLNASPGLSSREKWNVCVLWGFFSDIGPRCWSQWLVKMSHS